jgi:hypothetical protein
MRKSMAAQSGMLHFMATPVLLPQLARREAV